MIDAWNRVTRSLLVTLAALLLAMPAARAETDAATAEALMRASGVWAQLDKVAPQVHEGVAAALTKEGRQPDAAALARIYATADEAYGGKALREAVRAFYQDHLDPGHAAAATKWFTSAPGKALVQVEEASAARVVDPMVRLQEGMKLLETLPPARRARLEEYVKLTRAAEAMANVTVHLATATNVGVALADPEVKVVDVDTLREALEDQRPRMLQVFPRIVMGLFAKIYESVPDADLARYIAYLGTPAGRHFTDVALRALEAALADAEVEWPRSVVAHK